MLPQYLRLAIEHEKKVIALRKRQVEACEQRLMLMEAGMGYYTALKKVPPVAANSNFPERKYMQLKDKFDADELRKKKMEAKR